MATTYNGAYRQKKNKKIIDRSKQRKKEGEGGSLEPERTRPRLKEPLRREPQMAAMLITGAPAAMAVCQQHPDPAP